MLLLYSKKFPRTHKYDKQMFINNNCFVTKVVKYSCTIKFIKNKIKRSQQIHCYS